MRKLSFALFTALTCLALPGCGDSAAVRQAVAARRAAEERAIAAEKALAEQRVAEQKAAAAKRAAEAEAARARAAAEAPAERRSKANYDKEAFLTARKAASVRTWAAAHQILKRIDLDRIQDSDVITYVDFSRRCAKLASDLGVDRDADPNSTESVMSSLNVEKFVASVFQMAKDKGVGQAAQAIADARQIQKERPVYTELDSKLAARYGTE